jgi:hypothetical protein
MLDYESDPSEGIAVGDLIESWQVSESEVSRLFATTRWNVVKAAGEDGSTLSQHALETLCSSYWHPVTSMFVGKGMGRMTPGI